MRRVFAHNEVADLKPANVNVSDDGTVKVAARTAAPSGERVDLGSYKNVEYS